MNWKLLILGLLVTTALVSGCTSEWTSNSEPDVNVKALVRAWGCPIPYDSTKTVYFDDFFIVQTAQLLDDTPSRRAMITFQGSNHMSESEFTDESSHVEFTLRPGTYRVLIESSYWKPDTIANLQIFADTSIILDYICNLRQLPGGGR